MSFAGELAALLPPDLPNRDVVIDLSARHLEKISGANRFFNLTRITGEREAAIKHVLDSLMPWRRFMSAQHVLDAGTGAGYPGIPLAIALPGTQFTLCESIGKKARFVEAVVSELRLPNVSVIARRAEEVLGDLQPGVITARAVAPIDRASALFTRALRRGSVVLLYKGPDAESEIAEASARLRKEGIRATVVERYELPESAGARTLVQLSRC